MDVVSEVTVATTSVLHDSALRLAKVSDSVGALEVAVALGTGIHVEDSLRPGFGESAPVEHLVAHGRHPVSSGSQKSSIEGNDQGNRNHGRSPCAKGGDLLHNLALLNGRGRRAFFVIESRSHG